jgi:hypothetical protein
MESAAVGVHRRAPVEAKARHLLRETSDQFTSRSCAEVCLGGTLLHTRDEVVCRSVPEGCALALCGLVVHIRCSACGPTSILHTPDLNARTVLSVVRL